MKRTSFLEVSTRDVLFFDDMGLEHFKRFRDVMAIRGSYIYYASSNRAGYYSLRVVFDNRVTVLNVTVFVGHLTYVPFYGWISKMLKVHGIKS